MASAVFKVIPLVDGKNCLAWFAKTFFRFPEVNLVSPLSPFCHSWGRTKVKGISAIRRTPSRNPHDLPNLKLLLERIILPANGGTNSTTASIEVTSGWSLRS